MNLKNLLLFVLSLSIVAIVFFTIPIKKDIVHKTEDQDSYKALEKSENPIARAQYEFNMLKNPATGKIPANIRNRELSFAKTMPKAGANSLSKTNDLSFVSRGPVNRGGRTRALAVDVKSTAGNVTLLAGGISGGIWKSTDDGSTWNQKITGSQLHNASCIAQDTKAGSESTWYAGTGEAIGNSADGGGGAYYLGNGIFKSTDNGETWSLLPSTAANSPQQFNSAFQFIYNIAVSPTTGTVVAAACATLQRSADGGNSWTKVKGALVNAQTSDVVVDKNGVFYASISSVNTDAGLWKSTDDGVTWTSITPTGFPGTYTRVVIAVSDSDPNRLYILAHTPGSGNVGPSPENDSNMFWKSIDGGANWMDKTSNLPTSTGDVAGYTSQGGYDMVIKVKPDDANFVVFGGTNLYRSTDGMETKVSNTSANWIGGYAIVNDISAYANHHSDNHSFAFSSVDSKVSYSGHDGGISRSADITADPNVWTNISHGYITSQFYSIAINPTTAGDNTIIGGLQDNGNYLTNSSSGTVDWMQLPFGGDGGFTAIASDKSSYLIETQNGSVYRLILDTNDNVLDGATLQPSGATGFTFINPFALDPNGKTLYMPIGNTIWRNSDITGVPTGSQNPTSVNWTNMTGTDKGSATSAVGISTVPANRLYYGTSDGEVYRVDNANTSDAATDIWSGKGFPVNAYVSCLAVDPTNADNVMLVFSNYGVKSIFYTSDGGANWTDVSGTLEQNPDGSGDGPSVRWASIAKINGTYTYYVSTSTGLYTTSNLSGTVTWTQLGANTIGNVVCPMVVTRNSDGLIAVATHGNGVYSSTISTTGVESNNSVTPTSYALLQNYPNPFNPSTKIKFSIPNSGNVKITVYDNLGREVATVVDRQLAAGSYTENFDASRLSSGVYFYRIASGNFVQTRKMILLK